MPVPGARTCITEKATPLSICRRDSCWLGGDAYGRLARLIAIYPMAIRNPQSWPNGDEPRDGSDAVFAYQSGPFRS